MKENIIDNIVRGVVFGALVWFGIRGVLPDIVAAGELPALFLIGGALIIVLAIGFTAYKAYRCARRCEPTCGAQFCHAG
ncbi:MAG TPA: hypothetical protein VIX18_04265 [Nitrospirota bacterium]